MATRTSIILAFALQVTLSTPLQVGLNMGSKSDGDSSGSSTGSGAGLGVKAQIGGLAAGIKGGIGGGVGGSTTGGISGGPSFIGGGDISRAGGLQANLDMGLDKDLGLSRAFSLGLGGSGGGVSGKANGGISIGGKSGGGVSLTGGGGLQGNILGDMDLGKHGLNSRFSLGESGSGTGASFEANAGASSGGSGESSGRASGSFSVGGNRKSSSGVSLTGEDGIFGGERLQGNTLGDMGLGKHGLNNGFSLGGSGSGTGVSFEANAGASSGGSGEAGGRASGSFSVGGKSSTGVSLTGEEGMIGGERLQGNRLGDMDFGKHRLNSGFSLGGSENGRRVSFGANSDAGSGGSGEASGGASLSGGNKGFILGGSSSSEDGAVGNMEISRQLGLSMDGNTGLNSQTEERSTDDGTSSYSVTSSKSGISSGGNLNVDRKSSSGKEENGGVGNANLGTANGGTGASFGLDLGELGLDGRIGLGALGGIDFGQLAAVLGSSDETLDLNTLGGSVFSGNLAHGGKITVPSMNGNIDLNSLGSLKSSLGGLEGSLDVGVNAGSLGGSGEAGMNVNLVPITSQFLSKALQYGSVPVHFISSGLSGAANAMGKIGSMGTSGTNLHIGIPSPKGLLGVRQLMPQLHARISGSGGSEGSAGFSSSGALGMSGGLSGSTGLGSGSGMSGSFGMGKGPRGGLRVVKAGQEGTGGLSAKGGLNVEGLGMKSSFGNGNNQNSELGSHLKSSSMNLGENLRSSLLKLPSFLVSAGSTSSATNTSQ